MQQIHNLAGQIYEQIGACGKSVCAYLKAYLHEQQAVNRLETLQKIRELCASLFEKPHAEIPGKKQEIFRLILNPFLANLQKVASVLKELKLKTLPLGVCVVF